jgi:hypothetical protein
MKSIVSLGSAELHIGIQAAGDFIQLQGNKKNVVSDLG